MMGKLTLRNLAKHKVRLLLSAAAVALAVAFVSGTLIFRDTSTRSFDRLFSQAYQSADVAVRAKRAAGTDESSMLPVPRSLLATLRQRVPDAASFYGEVEGYAAIVGKDDQLIGAPGTAQRGRAFDSGNPNASWRLLSGHGPVAPDDVAIDSRSATEGGFKVGDHIDILTQQATQTMRVSGIFTVGNSSLDDVVTYVAFTPPVAQELLVKPDSYSTIWIRAGSHVTQEQLRDQVAAALPAGYQATTGKQETDKVKTSLNDLFSLLSKFILAFAAVSVFVGSFIIFNTFAMLAVQRGREMALLRAIGASRAQVTRSLLGEAIGIGVVGSTLGLGIGIGVAAGLQSLSGLFGLHLPGAAPVVTAATVWWSYAVGVVITAVAAYLPSRRAAKTPPVAVLRSDVSLPNRSLTLRLIVGGLLLLFGAIALGTGLTDRSADAPNLVGVAAVAIVLAMALLSPLISRPIVWLVGLPFVWLARGTGRLSRENARRDPRRTAATASALMIGLALVSLASVVAESTNASVNAAFDRKFGADYSLESRGLSGFSSEAVKKVAAVRGVRAVVPVQFGALKIAGGETSVMVADPVALSRPISLDIQGGTAAIGSDDMLVQRRDADERGWKVGSVVDVEYPDAAKATLRVAGIFADNPVASFPYLVTPAGYQAHGRIPLVQKAFVTVQEKSPGELRANIEAALRAYPNVQLQDRQQAKTSARSGSNQLLTVIVALLALSIVIAALGIVNTLSLAAAERTRELGLLRAVGMGRRQIRRMIRYESVMIAVFGATLGIAIGVAFGWAMQRTLAAQGVDVLSIPVTRLLLYLAGAAVIGVIAAVLPAWRAARMNILEAIATA